MLTFWKDGFSIGGGPLMPYSDVKNQKILEAINAGYSRRLSLLLNPVYSYTVPFLNY